MAETQEKGIVGRARGMSLSLMNATPQLGMWQATGTAIAQAPNLTELREPESGGSNIDFDAHGHSIRTAKPDEGGELTLVKTHTKTFGSPVEEAVAPKDADVEVGHKALKHHHGLHRRRTLQEKHASPHKESWGPTIKNGLKAFWVFFLTPSGFLITIYGLNVVVRLGRHALLPAAKRGAGHVPPKLQRRLLAAQDLAGDRLADPQRAVLRHGLWARALALPRLLLDDAQRARPRPERDASAVHPEQGVVPATGLVHRERERGGWRGGEADVYGAEGAADGYVEAGVYGGYDGVEYAVAGCVVFLHVAL
ncbi:hypothetical protein OPT61_g358 [Boeremia exigua]|uniref:Uncharacterized protein n=1 Tax=Boeremia exigua TaxID=749465 RepID=A0ACC2IUK0_9PLEO|nr:hypothetical protein OPT61_g358 [Boeremia exigua]